MSQKCLKVYQCVSRQDTLYQKAATEICNSRKEKMKKEVLRIEEPLQICRGFLCVLHNFIPIVFGKMTNTNYFLTRQIKVGMEIAI